MNDLNTANDGIRRTKDRIKATGEVFTPVDLVDDMCARIPDDDWKDPTKTFLEPTFGSGNMLCRMLERRIAFGVTPMDAIRTMYGLELMQDNVDLCRKRVKDILVEHGQSITKEVEEILEHNLVCTDFFKWDLANWRPYTKGELILMGLDSKPVVPRLKPVEIPSNEPTGLEKFLKRKGFTK